MSGPADTLRRVADRLGPRAPRELRRCIQILDAAPASAQVRLGAAVGKVIPAVASLMPPYQGPLCEAYPGPSLAVQARLALGRRPAEVLRGLTPREAHEALADGYDDSVTWVCRVLPASVAHPRTLAVARWLVAVWHDPARRQAIETQRTHEGPGGAVVEGRLLDRVDEIRPCDLPRGAKTSVQEAFRRAAQRAYASWCQDHETDETPLAPAPSWWRPVRCAKLVMSRAALIREGRDMRHCVGTYAETVASGRSVIVSICVRVGEDVYRSTVEVDRSSRKVRQHHGAGNAEPPALCTRALAVLVSRWS